MAESLIRLAQLVSSSLRLAEAELDRAGGSGARRQAELERLRRRIRVMQLIEQLLIHARR